MLAQFSRWWKIRGIGLGERVVLNIYYAVVYSRPLPSLGGGGAGKIDKYIRAATGNLHSTVVANVVDDDNSLTSTTTINGGRRPSKLGHRGNHGMAELM